MICYQDRAWCTYHRDCAKRGECDRPLTDEVIARAREWWGGDTPPIEVFGDRPNCWEPE